MRSDGCGYGFNYSERLPATAAALSDTYHPGNLRGLATAVRRAGYAIGTDLGFDVIREFRTEIARKLKMPFRGRNELVPGD